MKISTLIEVLIFWGMLLGILAFAFGTIGNLQVFLSYLKYVYFIFVAFGMVRFVHKTSILESFGLLNWRYFSLVILMVISIGARYMSGIAMPNTFTSIVIAPISEEVFFRGYLLGCFKTKNATTTKAFSSIFFVTFLFTLAHVFKPDIGIVGLVFAIPCLGAMAGILYWVTKTIIPSITIHTAWNFFISTKPETRFTSNFWIWIILIFLPNILLVIEYFWMKRRESSL